MRYLILSLIISILLAGCSNDLKLKEELVKSRMDSLITTEDHNKVDINTLIDFSWEKAYVFTPYTSPENITEKLGFNWKDPTRIDYREDINLIVFVKDKKVVKYIELPRKYGDFDTYIIENGITPENTVVHLTKLQ